jgi:hypothetical protein
VLARPLGADGSGRHGAAAGPPCAANDGSHRTFT